MAFFYGSNDCCLFNYNYLLILGLIVVQEEVVHALHGGPARGRVFTHALYELFLSSRTGTGGHPALELRLDDLAHGQIVLAIATNLGQTCGSENICVLHKFEMFNIIQELNVILTFSIL